jgi:hypothetical protein
MAGRISAVEVTAATRRPALVVSPRKALGGMARAVAKTRTAKETSSPRWSGDGLAEHGGSSDQDKLDVGVGSPDGDLADGEGEEPQNEGGQRVVAVGDGQRVVGERVEVVE